MLYHDSRRPGQQVNCYLAFPASCWEQSCRTPTKRQNMTNQPRMCCENLESRSTPRGSAMILNLIAIGSVQICRSPVNSLFTLLCCGLIEGIAIYRHL